MYACAGVGAASGSPCNVFDKQTRHKQSRSSNLQVMVASAHVGKREGDCDQDEQDREFNAMWLTWTEGCSCKGDSVHSLQHRRLRKPRQQPLPHSVAVPNHWPCGCRPPPRPLYWQKGLNTKKERARQTRGYWCLTAVIHDCRTLLQGQLLCPHSSESLWQSIQKVFVDGNGVESLNRLVCA